jgi:hypothetical protein
VLYTGYPINQDVQESILAHHMPRCAYYDHLNGEIGDTAEIYDFEAERKKRRA